MGLDIQSLRFLKYANTKKSLGDVITIGRQRVRITASHAHTEFNQYTDTRYCEDFLYRVFQATGVESIDYSDYEGATHLHDMNTPLPFKLSGLYDTVIDAGSLEHVYNFPQAVINCSLLSKPGGQIIHILPANNNCGHGFYQFSPELFFSLYSVANGYTETEIFIINEAYKNHWFKVSSPEKGARVKINSCSGLYLLVRTVRKTTAFSHSDIQQSDYTHVWSKTSTEPILRKNKWFLRMYRLYLKMRFRLDVKNGGVIATPVSRLKP